MKIRYLVTREDLVKSQLRALFHNRINMGICILVVALGCIMTWNGETSQNNNFGYKTASIVVFAVISLGFILGFASLITTFAVLARKNKGVLGEHFLTITEDGLLEKTEFNESLNKWAGFHRAIRTKGYLYLYVTDASYLIISRKRPLLEGDLRSFEELLNQKLRLHKNS